MGAVSSPRTHIPNNGFNTLYTPPKHLFPNNPPPNPPLSLPPHPKDLPIHPTPPPKRSTSQRSPWWRSTAWRHRWGAGVFAVEGRAARKGAAGGARGGGAGCGREVGDNPRTGGRHVCVARAREGRVKHHWFDLGQSAASWSKRHILVKAPRLVQSAASWSKRRGITTPPKHRCGSCPRPTCARWRATGCCTAGSPTPARSTGSRVRGAGWEGGGLGAGGWGRGLGKGASEAASPC